jgi:hypothetical protein
MNILDMLRKVVYGVKAITIRTRGILSQPGMQRRSHSKKSGGEKKEEKKN